MLCLGVALFVFAKLKGSAASLPDEARVNENDLLTYYITVNSDGIDWTSTESSDDITAEEVSGITTVTDVLPDGLTFEGFVTSSDGAFGAVQRDDQVTACSGKVIDDTNEASTDEGVWNSDNTEYTYHGLHYNANTRTVTFRTKGIGAGCELTVGVISRTPTLPEGTFRMDFYDHAKFVDESLFGNSNTVHAWIQKDATDGEWWISYRYDGEVPTNAPALPPTDFYASLSDPVTIAPVPTLEGYTFDGWYWDNSSSQTKLPASSLRTLPGKSIELYGEWIKDGDEPIPDDTPVKYDVSYSIDGTKPDSFTVPAGRSYYEGASVEIDPTKDGENFDGYDFSGWETDDVELGDNDTAFTMPSKNVALRGSFDRQSYSVSYEFIGDVKPANAGSLLPQTTEHYAGDSIEVAGAPSAEGYTFSGWYADPSFEMPAESVTIKGEWTKNKTEFTPEIAIEITNPQPEFYKGDTVKFKVTVTNNQDFDLNNVWLEEILDGAYFVTGEGYTIESISFADIATVPAHGSVDVFAEYVVSKNMATVYTNTVELIALDADNSDFVLPEEWENGASVDFVTGIIEDEPIDEGGDGGSEEKTPKTYDGIGKAAISASIIAGGFGLCVVLLKRTRRGGIVYGYCAAILAVSGLSVVLINGGISLADSISETPELDIYSTILNYENGDAGAWKVHESGEWVGVGEAKLRITAESKKISDLHNKDVVLILDNGKWTKSAINGTEPDDESDLPSMALMKNGAIEFVNDLLEDGDSRVMVIPTWGSTESSLTDDLDVAIAQIDAIESTDDTNYYGYSASYDKVLNWLDYYEESDDRALNIVYVADDHIANSGDIAKYKMIKAKAPNAIISGIGFGVKELINERYTSAASADENGVARYWYGTDGNLRPIGGYSDAVNGLDKISDYHENPYYKEYVPALVRSVDGSLLYSKFNIDTTINTDDFEIRGIYGDVGDIQVSDNKISWINEEKGLVSGAKYEMSVLLKAKDSSVEKHKLYQLNSNTNVTTDATDIEEDSNSSVPGIVLKNGYELTFNINNEGVCNLGNNTSGVYLAFQRIDLDEESVSCDGWNFDTFKSSVNGTIYSAHNNIMPVDDMELMATWRKVDVEVHMDGQIHSVAPAILKKGEEFNQALYQISRARYSELMRKAEACPRTYMDDDHRLSDDASPTAVYAWFTTGAPIYDVNPRTGESDYLYSSAVYYCTDADKIMLNEDSTGMFSDYTYYTYDDDTGSVEHRFETSINLIDESVADWDASNVKKMDYFFAGTELGLVTLERMKDWDISKVESMDNLFYYKGQDYAYDRYSENALAGWNTKNVKSMKNAFAYTVGVLENVGGIAKWNVSSVENMSGLAYKSGTTTTNMFSEWDTQSVKDLSAAFSSMGRSWSGSASGSQINLSGLSGWNTASVENMSQTFYRNDIADLNAIKDWDVSNVKNFNGMFSGSTFTTNGVDGSPAALEGWMPTSATDMSGMFGGSNISDLTKLTWNDDVKNVENFSNMFSGTKYLTSLDGLDEWNVGSATTLAGIFWNDTALVDIQALDDWNVANVTDLSSAFRGASVNDLNALHDWDVSKVTKLDYTFCGAPEPYNNNQYTFDCDDGTSDKFIYHRNNSGYGGPKSLAGLEGWKDKTGNVESMNSMLAGGVVTDLSPISEWNVTGVKSMSKTFHRVNVQNFDDLSEWETTSLTNLEYAFSFAKATTLSGLDEWDVTKVTNMNGTFSYMYNLTSAAALYDWKTESLTSMGLLFSNHRVLTSLHGLENWDISKVSSFYSVFEGDAFNDPEYNTDWSQNCKTQLTDVSALSGWTFGTVDNMERFFACDNKITSLSSLSDWRIKLPSYITSLDRFLEGASSLQSLSGVEHWFDESATTNNIPAYPTFNYAFMNMSNLRDITALASWTNPSIQADGIKCFMRNDTYINSLAPLEDSFFKYMTSSTSTWTQDAFDRIPSSVARPTWYHST